MTIDLIQVPCIAPEQALRIEAEFRIPVDTAYPSTYWIACLDRESVMPTDLELQQLQSFIEYAVKTTYNETWQQKIFAKPLPAEGMHVTKIFRKGAHWQNGENPHNEDPLEGWRYRKCTWEHGYWPFWQERRLPTLADCLDALDLFAGEHSERWLEWKTARPALFPASPVTVSRAPESQPGVAQVGTRGA